MGRTGEGKGRKEGRKEVGREEKVKEGRREVGREERDKEERERGMDGKGEAVK